MAAVCTLCLCAGLCLNGQAAGVYTDVAADTWYAGAVEEITAQGYMTGIDENTFAPDMAVTRATVLTVLWRLEGSPEAWVESPFPDVAAGSWYETAAAWAKGKGIATGDGKGQLNPNAPVTRQELAVFFYRYAQYKGMPAAEGSLNLYTDGNMTSLWAVEGVRHAIGMGLLEGSDGKINPGGTATRGQLTVILQRWITPAAG